MITTPKLSARATLIYTLTDLLHKKPFQKISVNELCETAGVSRSTFYANFDSFLLYRRSDQFNHPLAQRQL